MLPDFDSFFVTAFDMAPRLAAGIIAFFAVIFFGKFSTHIIKKLLRKSDISEIHFDFFLKISGIFFFFIAIVLFLNVVGLKSIAAGLFAGGGIIAVTLGFAFREIGENLLAGLLLSFNRPFKKGDLIKSGNFEGTVTSIEITSTHIKGADGEDIFIPSSQIYKNPLINFTKDGSRRFTIHIGVAYDSDIALASRIIGEEVAKNQGVLKNPKACVVIHKIMPGYLEIESSFWIDVFVNEHNVGKIKTDLIVAIKDRLLASDFILSNNVAHNVNFKVSSDVLSHDFDRTAH